MVEQEKIDDLIYRIVDAVHPHRIILFGSNARGTAGPDSDLDVLVIMPDGSDRRAVVTSIYRSLKGFSVVVDVVVATQRGISVFGNTHGLIYKPALQDGIELYAA